MADKINWSPEELRLREQLARAIFSSFGQGSPDDWQQDHGKPKVYYWEAALPQVDAIWPIVTAALKNAEARADELQERLDDFELEARSVEREALSRPM